MKKLNSKEIVVVIAVLTEIERELARCYWNKYHKKISSPFANTGQKYSNDTFSVSAYYWWMDGQHSEAPNFKCDDITVYWYKHVGRGTEVFVPDDWDFNKLPDMVDKCIRSIQRDFGDIQE